VLLQHLWLWFCYRHWDTISRRRMVDSFFSSENRSSKFASNHLVRRLHRHCFCETLFLPHLRRTILFPPKLFFALQSLVVGCHQSWLEFRNFLYIRTWCLNFLLAMRCHQELLFLLTWWELVVWDFFLHFVQLLLNVLAHHRVLGHVAFSLF
jgi:hypothetical protein